MLLTIASSCSPNKDMVDKATAYDTYYTASYEHKCKPNPTEEPCKSCKATINSGEWKIKTANINAKLGTLPPAEKAELEALIEALKGCP